MILNLRILVLFTSLQVASCQSPETLLPASNLESPQDVSSLERAVSQSEIELNAINISFNDLIGSETDFITLQVAANLQPTKEVLVASTVLHYPGNNRTGFGYYLADPLPWTDGNEQFNYINFVVWNHFMYDPDQPITYVDIEQALEAGLPDAKWVYGFLQLNQNRTSLAQKERGLKILLEAAEEQDMNAVGMLAWLYYTGSIGLAPDHDKARYWAEIGAANFDPGSLLVLGLLHLQGRITGFDRNQGLDYLVRAAELGLNSAAYFLAVELLSGINTRMDLPSALLWMQIAAENHYAPAQFVVGILHGYAQEYRDDSLSTQWMELAAKQGQPEAMYFLAMAYRDGKGTMRNENQYRYFLERSIDKNFDESQVELAQLYFSGLGLRQYSAQNLPWLAILVLQNNEIETFELANRFDQGMGVPVRPQLAQKLRLLAGRLEIGYEMYLLGYAFQYGQGRAIDIEVAMEWYRKAIAHSDNPYAHLALGYLLLQQDPETGASHILAAAKQGDAEATRILQDMFVRGQFLHLDIELALNMLDKAAQDGDLPSLRSLFNIYYFGEQVPQDLDRAFFYALKAAEGGDAETQINVGMAYLDGFYFDKNAQQGKFWIDSGLAILRTQAADGDLRSRLMLSTFTIRGITNDMYFQELETSLESGNLMAIPILAKALHEGIGVDPDHERAYALSHRGAELGIPESQFQAALMLAEGEGTAQDRIEAYKWMSLSQMNGHPRAQEYLDNLEARMSQMDLEEAKARISAWRIESDSSLLIR